MKPYVEMFKERGAAYDRAMQKYPNARVEEFLQAVAPAQLTSGMVVADIPAGGGYLARYLPEGCIWRGHEPCASFTHHGGVAEKSLNLPLIPLPWADESVDAAISLAGVHHQDDKRPLFAEILRVTRPGGRFVLSDVAADTPVARFLDGFVGSYNSTGHEGMFLDKRTLHELEEAGWMIQSVAQKPFHWVFPDRDAMADFCRGLFDICKASTSEVEKAIDDCLGADVLPDGNIGMRWSLMTIVAVKPGA